MSGYKEIVTKAVIGKGKRATDTEYTVVPNDKPNTILGCWIINHNFNGKIEGETCIINGSFDVNIWYSYDNDTKTNVHASSYNYSDRINVPINQKSKLSNDLEVILTSITDPNVSEVIISDEKVTFKVHKEMKVEVVGDALIRVNAYELEDNYIDLNDTNFQSTYDEIDKEVNTNFLKDEFVNNEE